VTAPLAELRGQLLDAGQGIVALSLQALVLRGELINAGAEVGGTELVELLAEGATDRRLESSDFFAQAAVVLLEQLLLQLPADWLLGTGVGAAGCGASLTVPRGFDVLAHALGVDEPVRHVRGAGDPGEGDRFVLRDQLVDNGQDAGALVARVLLSRVA
jgi:hypothetical protein